jgi:hypothetical protein
MKILIIALLTISIVNAKLVEKDLVTGDLIELTGKYKGVNVLNEKIKPSQLSEEKKIGDKVLGKDIELVARRELCIEKEEITLIKPKNLEFKFLPGKSTELNYKSVLDNGFTYYFSGFIDITNLSKRDVALLEKIFNTTTKEEITEEIKKNVDNKYTVIYILSSEPLIAENDIIYLPNVAKVTSNPKTPVLGEKGKTDNYFCIVKNKVEPFFDIEGINAVHIKYSLFGLGGREIKKGWF